MALRRNTVLGTMPDAIAYVASRPGDTGPLLAVMKAIGSQIDIVNFEVAPSFQRVMGMLRTGGTVTIRLVTLRRSHPKDALCLRFAIPSNFRDYEVLYFGGVKPDGSAAIHGVRSRDIKNEKRMSIPLEE
jgi:hypothetical protein